MASQKIVQHDRLPISYNPQSRRMFLKGLGSFALSLPLLPSLIPRVAQAQTFNHLRRAIFLTNRHGGLSLDFDAQNLNYNQVAPNVRVASIANAQLGPIFPSQYNSLRSKMTLLRGLDVVDAWAHMFSPALAASGSAPEVPGSGQPFHELRCPIPDSVDTLLSKSDKVYPNGSNVRLLRVAAFENLTHSIENYRVQPGIQGTRALFDLVSRNIVVQDPGSTGPTEQDLNNLRKKKIVDSALASLNKVLNSRDIASDEKPMVENYASLLSQIQDDIPEVDENNLERPVANYRCDEVTYTQEGEGGQARARKMCDIIVAAMACGVTRVATMNLPAEHFYVHRVDSPNHRQSHINYLRDNVMPIAAHLISLMDSVTDANGQTMLHNSLVMQTSDLASSKFQNHHGCNFPVFTAGTLDGLFRTGVSIDYQNFGHSLQSFNSYGGSLHGGRLYNELLISIMRGFGLQQADYSYRGAVGYGMYEYRGGHSGGGDRGTEIRLSNYVRDVYLRQNTNRDQTLPHFYLG